MTAARSLLPSGVHVLERGWLSSNNILVMGRDTAALVDSGYVTHAQQTLELVAARLDGRPLTSLLNTHLHSDHCGGNAALQARFPGVRTLIPPGLAAYVRDWDPVALTYEPTGQQCPRFTYQDLLTPGREVVLGDTRWAVHAAPGHDPNSVILFEPASRTLLSADALWENGFGIVFQELEGERAFDEVADTLTLIESLKAAVVIPGHGAVFSDVDQALARARSRLAAYVANPQKHAAHAAKVLLKFKLLELQQVTLSSFVAWAEMTPYFRLVRERWFAGSTMESWIAQLAAELEVAGAARREADLLVNR
jgi:glyoxylase-like metal-dependent hydrolase (beta-lactamase superfamily II)